MTGSGRRFCNTCMAPENATPRVPPPLNTRSKDGMRSFLCYCRLFAPRRLAQDFLRRTVIHRTVASRFDKAHDLQRDRRVEWRFSGLEHLHDFLQQLAVNDGRANGDWHHVFLCERDGAIVALPDPDTANRGDPAV